MQPVPVVQLEHVSQASVGDVIPLQDVSLEAAQRATRMLQLSAGRLLPASGAPGVVEVRKHLDASVRQVVIASADLELLFVLAERLAEDPELWELAAAAMRKGDTRHALALMHVELVKKRWSVDVMDWHGSARKVDDVGTSQDLSWSRCLIGDLRMRKHQSLKC